MRIIHWKKSVPFVRSKQGKLIHRVRHAGSYLNEGVYSHDFVSYWCNNGTTSPEWLENPPDGAIVCQHCERIAVEKGERPTDEIVGKHVHIGTLIAIKTCCVDKN